MEISSFSPRQRSLINAALSLLALVFMVAVGIGLFWLMISFFQFFSGVFLPLAVAAVFALMLRPCYQYLLARVNSPLLSLLLLLAGLIVPFVVLFWFFGSIIVEQLVGLLQSLPRWYESFLLWWQERLPMLAELDERYGLYERAAVWLKDYGGLLAMGAAEMSGKMVSAGSALFRSVTGLLGWAVMPLYFIFILMLPAVAPQRLEGFFPFVKEQTRKDIVYLVGEFVRIMVAFFRGQLLVAFCQGLLYGLGFSLIGLKYGFVLGMLFGLFNIIPYLGNILGLIIVLPIAYFQVGGGATLLLAALAVFVVTQLIESFILTPKIMGKRTGLHPGIIIFAIFFWGTALGGILGMILAIPLTAFLVVFWRLLRTRCDVVPASQALADKKAGDDTGSA